MVSQFQKTQIIKDQNKILMDSISTFTGKFLFIIRSMEKEGLISIKDKGNLKDLLFDRPQCLKSVYQDYLSDGTELTLKSDLLKLLKKERQNESCDGSSSHSRLSRKAGMSIKIPEKNIQKLPAGLQRL